MNSKIYNFYSQIWTILSAVEDHIKWGGKWNEIKKRLRFILILASFFLGYWRFWVTIRNITNKIKSLKLGVLFISHLKQENKVSFKTCPCQLGRKFPLKILSATTIVKMTFCVDIRRINQNANSAAKWHPMLMLSIAFKPITLCRGTNNLLWVFP